MTSYANNYILIISAIVVYVCFFSQSMVQINVGDLNTGKSIGNIMVNNHRTGHTQYAVDFVQMKNCLGLTAKCPDRRYLLRGLCHQSQAVPLPNN